MLNAEAKRGSAVLEVLVSAILITGVAVGVYTIQHQPAPQPASVVQQ